MKICFIGLGSIGKKHIKNLVHILKERTIEFTIDAVRQGARSLEDEISSLLNQTYTSFEMMPKDYDIVFITNPTSMHYDTFKAVKDKTKHLFIEKPLFDQVDASWEKELEEAGHVYYVACPLRYHPVIQYVKEYSKVHHIFSVRSICSSYLPNWRKNVDYRTVYSAIKEQGGGVSLDLIHEWDYLTYLFGMPLEVMNLKGTYSDLEITSDDLSVYIAKYQDKLVEVHLDYFGRKETRKVTLYTRDEVIEADIINHQINKYGEKNETITLEREDMYINEMNYFLDLILEGKENHNGIKHAYETLKIALNEGGRG